MGQNNYFHYRRNYVISGSGIAGWDCMRVLMVLELCFAQEKESGRENSGILLGGRNFSNFNPILQIPISNQLL